MEETEIKIAVPGDFPQVDMEALRNVSPDILGWLTGRPSGFRSLERVSYALGLLMMLCAMPAVLLVWLVPATPVWLLQGWLAVLAVAAFLVYLRRGSSMNSQTGFSVFFWVLYLCGLELLPICVVVNILMHGN